MGPTELCDFLRQIASMIDASSQPSRRLVASAVYRLLLATDESLALSIGEAIVSELNNLLPSVFDGKYDTSDRGKGFKEGYISFGMTPMEWRNAGLIGGILFRMNFDTADYKSEKPSSGPYGGHSKGVGAISLQTKICYYNKKLGGGCSGEKEAGAERSLGIVDVLLDEQEGVQEVAISDAGAFKKSINDLIQEVIANPPEYAQSAGLKKKHDVPTGSPKSLLNWLIKNGRSDVGQSEIDALARAISTRTERPFEQLQREVKDFFRNSHWAINPKG